MSNVAELQCGARRAAHLAGNAGRGGAGPEVAGAATGVRSGEAPRSSVRARVGVRARKK